MANLVELKSWKVLSDMDFTNNWQSKFKWLKPIGEELIPVRSNGYRIKGHVKSHNLTDEDVLVVSELKAVGLTTSSEIVF